MFLTLGPVLSPKRLAAQAVDPASLPLLPGQGCAVRYSAGTLDRAHHVLLRLEVIAYHFGKWTQIPTPMAAYVLTREDWEASGFGRPYGLPSRTGLSGVAVAAMGDEGTVALWNRLLSTRELPMVPGVPLHGTPEQAATLALADVLLQAEASRGFVVRTGLVGKSRWVGEVAAHLTALTLFHLHEKPRLGEIRALYSRLSSSLGGPGAHDMASYRPNISLEDWLWFQAQFFKGAEVIFKKDGKKGIKRLLKVQRQTGNPVEEGALLAMYPQLVTWFEASFEPVAEP